MHSMHGLLFSFFVLLSITERRVIYIKEIDDGYTRAFVDWR